MRAGGVTDSDAGASESMVRKIGPAGVRLTGDSFDTGASITNAGDVGGTALKVFFPFCFSRSVISLLFVLRW